jgi:hypothetical protein
MFSFKRICNFYSKKQEKKIEKKKIQKSFIIDIDSYPQTDLDTSINSKFHNIQNINNNDSNIFNLFNNLSPTIKDHVLLEYGNVDIIYRDLYNELNSVRCQNLNHHNLTTIIKKVINNQIILDYIYYKDSLFHKYYNIYFINNKNNLFDDSCEKLCIDWINELYNENIELYNKNNFVQHNYCNNNINTNIDDDIDDNNVGLDIGI